MEEVKISTDTPDSGEALTKSKNEDTIQTTKKEKIVTNSSVVEQDKTVKQHESTISVLQPSSGGRSFINLIINGKLVTNTSSIKLFTLDYILFILNFLKSIEAHQNATDTSGNALATMFSWVDVLIRNYFSTGDVVKKVNYLGGVTYEVTSKDASILNRALFYNAATFSHYTSQKAYEDTPDVQVRKPILNSLSGEKISAEAFLARSFKLDATKVISFWKGVFDSIGSFPFKFVYNWYEPYIKYAIAMAFLPAFTISDIFNSKFKMAAAEVTNPKATPYDYWVTVVMLATYSSNINATPVLKYFSNEDYILNAGLTNFMYMPALITCDGNIKELGVIPLLLSKTKTDTKLECFGEENIYLRYPTDGLFYSASGASYPEFLKLMMSKRKYYFGLLDQRLDFSTAYKQNDWLKANSYMISIMSYIPFEVHIPYAAALNQDYRSQPMANNLFSDVVDRKPSKVFVLNQNDNKDTSTTEKVVNEDQVTEAVIEPEDSLTYSAEMNEGTEEQREASSIPDYEEPSMGYDHLAKYKG